MATETAIFAAGCFWGVQDYIDHIPGVLKTTVGYCGGEETNPTYEQVSAHATGHAEALKVEFDPTKVSYQTLLKHFFKLHDPTQYMRQGPDVGPQYRSAVFYTTEEQNHQAQAYIRELEAKQPEGKPIVTELNPAGPFYDAEDGHQKFVKKNGYGACHVPYQPL